MSVRPNGLGASRAALGAERDEETAARHRGFLDLMQEDRPQRGVISASVPSQQPLQHLRIDEVVAVSARLSEPDDADADELTGMTKWPLVIGTLVVAVAILIGLGVIGALPFR